MEQKPKRIRIRTPRTTMKDLNFDVLRDTFGHFNVEDLIVMADVCTTFRQVARKEFSSRHKTVILRAKVMESVFEVDGVKKMRRGKNFEVNRFRNLFVARSHWISVLRIFGDSITSLAVAYEQFDEHPPVLKAIVEYCSESLVHLTLCKAKLTNEMILEWRPLLSRLQRLILSYCDFNSGAEADGSLMLIFCVKLQWLEIAGEMSFDRPVALPQLKCLNLYDSHLTKTDVERLIVLNPKLVHLSLPSSTLDFELISTRAPNIEYLMLRWDGIHTPDWKNFNNLESLSIIGPVTVTTLLESIAAAAIPLRKLQLMQVRVTNECIAQLSKLVNLKSLHLMFTPNNLGSSEVLSIVRNSPDLILTLHGSNNPLIVLNPEILQMNRIKIKPF